MLGLVLETPCLNTLAQHLHAHLGPDGIDHDVDGVSHQGIVDACAGLGRRPETPLGAHHAAEDLKVSQDGMPGRADRQHEQRWLAQCCPPAHPES
jgi:hypothetical protein